MNLAVYQKTIYLTAGVPLLLVLFFFVSAFMLGNPGFKVDKTQYGLSVSEIHEKLNPVEPGDLIFSVNGLSYGQLLGFLVTRPVQPKKNTISLKRDGKPLTLTLHTVPYTLSSFLIVTWPHLLLIALFLSLGLIAILRAPPDKTTILFFLMVCGFASSIAATLASHLSLLIPPVMSASFIGLAVFNWLSFGAWAHFTCCFPKERNIVQKRPWLPPLFYLLPPAVTVAAAFAAAGTSQEFWEWLQRLRNMFVPIIICGAFIKHLIDFIKLPGTPARNQIKLPLTAYWLSLGPYFFLYLLPNLFINHPLIHFRTVILAFLILPLAYLFALLRYRLFEVDKMISRVIAYVILIITITLLYSLFLVVIKQWLWGRNVLSQELFLVFTVAVIALFNPSVNLIQRNINRFIFRNIPIRTSTLLNLSRRISTALKLSDLTRVVTSDLPKQFALTKVAIAVIDNNQVQFYPAQSARTLPDLKVRREVVDRFNGHDEYLLCRPFPGDAQRTGEMEELNRMGWAIIFRLQGSSGLAGLLFIGDKTSGQLFNEDDIHFLATLASHTGIALENGLRYERLAKSKKQQEETFKKLVQTEKMATIGEMTTTLAHELKNPLAIIRSSAQYVAEGKHSNAVSQEMLTNIIDEVDALNLTISSLLGHARHRPPVFKPVDLPSTIPAILNHWKQSSDHNPAIDILCDIPDNLPRLHCDVNQLNQIILNLIRNAEEAMEQSGKITVQVSNADSHALIRIIDSGAGIDQEHLEDVFHNFFTTKVSGIGLGLPVCRHLVHAHNGSMNLKNSEYGSAEALVLLPFEPYEETIDMHTQISEPGTA